MASDSASALVVGDGASRRERLSGLLRSAGLTVLEAKTGSSALAQLAVAPVEIVVLDVKLPDTTGYEVCEKIKSDRLCAGLAVIEVASAVHRARGVSSGADAYLVEPVDGDELITTVYALLRAHCNGACRR